MEDILFRTALQLNLPDLKSWCSSSRVYNTICSLPEFWKAYCEYHFYFDYNVGTKQIAFLIYDKLKKLEKLVYVSALWMNTLSKIITKEELDVVTTGELLDRVYDGYNNSMLSKI